MKIDGQMHSGNHSTKNQAKQKACENFFRDILKNKLSEQSGNFKMLNCFTFNIVHNIIYKCMY